MTVCPVIPQTQAWVFMSPDTISHPMAWGSVFREGAREGKSERAEQDGKGGGGTRGRQRAEKGWGGR